jgi:hypothetical protein
MPQCDGVDATAYVNEDGKIVDGPQDGHIYHKSLRGTLGTDVIVGTKEIQVIIG